MPQWNKILNSNKPIPTQLINGKGIVLNVYPYGVKICIYELQDINLYKTFIKQFTIEFPVMNYIKKVPIYKKTTDAKIKFPRFGMIQYANKFKNIKIKYHMQILTKPQIPFKWTGMLKDNQPLILKHIMKNYFNKKNAKIGKSGLILNLEAGQGKTYVATSLIQELKTKTLVICHNKNILYQWIEVLQMGYPNNTVTAYYGGKKECGDITVGIINSLLMDNMQINGKKTTPKEFFKQFGFVIFDEVHLYSGTMRKNIYFKLYATYILGLSATPDENVYFDKVNDWCCGDVLNAKTLKGYTTNDIPFKGNVTKIAYNAPDAYTQIILNEKTEMISHSQMVSQLCEDPFRIHLIVKLIFELKVKNKNIFVFADRRSYLTQIKDHMDVFDISSYNLLNTDDKEFVMQLMGGSSDSDIKKATIKSNVILTTYQFMGTGVSIPKMDAIILATPRKKKSKQYIGRIFRLGSNYNSTREIIDIVDVNTYMKSQYYIRKQYYDDKKFPIATRKVNWNIVEEEMKTMGFEFEKDISSNIKPINISIALGELESLLLLNTII
jgi:superfamily II DNA or RNA helicase